VLRTLGKRGEHKYRPMLIDEADAFIRAEAERDYPTLHQFRNLSEEGRCFFIFAGFWNLYHAASGDYQPPIKNFGETLTIGALEEDAWHDPITQPMTALNIRYESDQLIEHIIDETGRRANLIAIICNDVLKDIDMILIACRFVESLQQKQRGHQIQMAAAAVFEDSDLLLILPAVYFAGA
jgi:hypothetical protein